MRFVLTTLRGLAIMLAAILGIAFLPLVLRFVFGHRVGVMTFAAELVLVAAWVVGRITSREQK